MAPVLMVYVGHKTTKKINYSKYVENLTDGGQWTWMVQLGVNLNGTVYATVTRSLDTYYKSETVHQVLQTFNITQIT